MSNDLKNLTQNLNHKVLFYTIKLFSCLKYYQFLTAYQQKSLLQNNIFLFFIILNAGFNWKLNQTSFSPSSC